MANIDTIERARRSNVIISDVKGLIEKYRAIFDMNVPDFDQAAADRLILAEIRKALDAIDKHLPTTRLA